MRRCSRRRALEKFYAQGANIGDGEEAAVEGEELCVVVNGDGGDEEID